MMVPAVAPWVGLVHMLEIPFLRNALLAGTGIALACGFTGYFIVLRAQVFTADALSHVAFTGALAALAFGVDLRLGLYGACIGLAIIMAALGAVGRADDTVIGSVFAWVLGLGALFLSIYTTARSGAGGGTAGISVLFGSVLGISPADAWAAFGIGLGICAAMLAIARPLLFATLDEAVARARGVPVRALSYAFLILVGLTAAEATQAVGAFLLLGLLAAPGGAAQRLSGKPFVALGLTVVIAVGSVWAGLTLTYLAPKVLPSFGIIAVATSAYVLAFAVSVVRERRSRSGTGPQVSSGLKRGGMLMRRVPD